MPFVYRALVFGLTIVFCAVHGPWFPEDQPCGPGDNPARLFPTTARRRCRMPQVRCGRTATPANGVVGLLLELVALHSIAVFGADVLCHAVSFAWCVDFELAVLTALNAAGFMNGG